MKLFRQLIVVAHRYLGIALGGLLIVWFASGIVMMYTGGLPSLTAQQRMEQRAPVDLSAVRVAPAEAAGEARGPFAGDIALVTVLGRPAYRISGRDPVTVFADNGRRLQTLSAGATRDLAAAYLNLPREAVHFDRTLAEVDQWTLQMSSALPLHKFRVHDGRGTEIYVSPRTAEVELLTTRSSRALAWIGVIPHWFYFEPLRTHQRLWYDIVVWTSGVGCGLVLLGLVLGVIQLRKTRPFNLAAAIPYVGWMRWHYLAGACFGIFALTFVFSGLLSMEPFAWTNATGLRAPRAALSGGPVDYAAYPRFETAGLAALTGDLAVKEVGFTRIHGEHFYVVTYTQAAPRQEPRAERRHQPYQLPARAGPKQLLVTASAPAQVRTEAFDVESILDRLQAAMPDAPIVEHAVLDAYDDYYYSRGGQAPLPVLRVKYDDPARSWFYIDPARSRVVAELHRFSRLERWLFNGLHSLDFSFWYGRRPLWDIGVILLCLGGFAASALGLYLGLKRTGYDIQRLVDRGRRLLRLT